MKSARIISLISTVSSFAMTAQIALAANEAKLCPSNLGSICNTPGSESVFNRILTILIIIGIIAALLFLIWGGIKWITAGGDKAKVTSARDTITGAIIGLVIVLASYFIITFVYRFVTGANFTDGFDIIPKGGLIGN